MQLAPAGYLERVHGIRFLHTHGNVCFHLFEKPFPYISARDVFALAPGKRRIVYHKVHAYGGLVYLNERQRLDMLGVAYGLSYIEIGNAGNAHDIAKHRLCAGHSFQSLKLIKFCDMYIFRAAVLLAEHIRGVYLDPAALHSANADPADIFIVFQRGKKHLRRAVRVSARRRYVF